MALPLDSQKRNEDPELQLQGPGFAENLNELGSESSTDPPDTSPAWPIH